MRVHCTPMQYMSYNADDTFESVRHRGVRDIRTKRLYDCELVIFVSYLLWHVTVALPCQHSKRQPWQARIAVVLFWPVNGCLTTRSWFHGIAVLSLCMRVQNHTVCKDIWGVRRRGQSLSITIPVKLRFILDTSSSKLQMYWHLLRLKGKCTLETGNLMVFNMDMIVKDLFNDQTLHPCNG